MRLRYSRLFRFALLFLFIGIAAQAQVKLISPADNAVIYTTSVTLTWEKYGSTATYYGELTREPLGENAAVYSTISGTSQNISGLAMDGSTYGWRIGTSSSPTSSSWSNYRFFRCATTVPYVISMDRVEAADKIIECKLTLGQEVEEYNDEVPANFIIRQDPPASTVAAPDSPVDLIVSRGSYPVVSVPDVVGLSFVQAESLLGSLGLWVGSVTTEYDDIVPKDKVSSQNPPPGTLVPQDEIVDLVVSKGPMPATVPNLFGLTRSEAESVLAQANLSLGTVGDGHHEIVPAGEIMSQTPAAGTNTVPGSAVAIVISQGSGDGCISGGCNSTSKSFKDILGDWLLVGLALIVLGVWSSKASR